MLQRSNYSYAGGSEAASARAWNLKAVWSEDNRHPYRQGSQTLSERWDEGQNRLSERQAPESALFGVVSHIFHPEH